MQPDIWFYEAFAEEQRELRARLPDGVKATFTWETIQESGHSDAPAALISVRTQSQIPPSWAGSLKGIISRSTGFDHLVRYRQLTGEACPQLAYLPLYCHRAVAEQALLLWLALLRKLSRQVHQFDRFDRDGLTGAESMGRTLVVVGVGNIGYEVACLGRGIGMRVFGVDIDPRHADVNYLEPAEALARADIVVCCMCLTAENTGYFSAERLAQVKKGAVFVNIARGELSPARALLPALETGRLSALALDVYDEEAALAGLLRGGVATESTEVAAIQQLRQRDDVILTPHNAFNTTESVQRKSAHTMEQLDAFQATGRFKWLVP